MSTEQIGNVPIPQPRNDSPLPTGWLPAPYICTPDKHLDWKRDNAVRIVAGAAGVAVEAVTAWMALAPDRTATARAGLGLVAVAVGVMSLVLLLDVAQAIRRHPRLPHAVEIP